MLKFLLILALVVYIVYKLGSLFYRAGAASQQFRDAQKRNFDSHSGSNGKARKSDGRVKGGEYIDYEEIK